jgi:hypothetical protein
MQCCLCFFLCPFYPLCKIIGCLNIGISCDLYPSIGTTCRCGYPMVTVSHIIYHCPSYEWGVRSQRAAVLCVTAQILRGKWVCFCVWRSLVQYRLGAVLCVWLGGYRVHPASLPYQGKLLVYKGASPCAPPAAVHCGRGPTPWHSLTLTSLHTMSLWLPFSSGWGFLV